jgi:hypothetical protein
MNNLVVDKVGSLLPLEAAAPAAAEEQQWHSSRSRGGHTERGTCYWGLLEDVFGLPRAVAAVFLHPPGGVNPSNASASDTPPKESCLSHHTNSSCRTCLACTSDAWMCKQLAWLCVKICVAVAGMQQ